MKKLLTVLLMAALAVSALTACGSNDTTSENNSSSSVEETTTAAAADTAAVTYPVEIKSELGTTVIEAEPNAIAVFDIGMLDILDTLGLGDRVVAVTHGQAFPDYLSKYDGEEYVNLGGFKTWDEEALANSNPDLIIAGFRQNKSIDTVTAVAPTIYFSDTDSETESYIDGLTKRVNAITALYGGADEAESYLKEINEKVAKIQAFAEENEVTFVIVTAENGSLSLGGSGSALLEKDLGFVSLYEDTAAERGEGNGEGDEEVKGGGQSGEGSEEGRGGGQGGEGREGRGGGQSDEAGESEGERGQMSEEGSAEQTAETIAYLTEQNPAYVFVFDKDAAEREEGQPTAEDILKGSGIENIEAYKNNNVICVDSAIWSSTSGGLKSTIQQLDTLLELFELN